MTDHEPCRECGTTDHSKFMRTGLPPGLCGTCDFWLEKVRWAEDGDTRVSVRVNGWHYYVGTQGVTVDRQHRGSYGDRKVIEFADGRRVETVDLWSQGEIPDRFRDRLPDNARFVSEEDPLEDTTTFVGLSDGHSVIVRQRGVADCPLRYRVFHSPTGFSWGYGGSGPCDLARSILWHVLDAQPVPSLYHDFKFAMIATLDKDEPFEIKAIDVNTFVGQWRIRTGAFATQDEIDERFDQALKATRG